MQESRLNILVLHAIDDFAALRQSTLRHVQALERYSSGNRFYYQSIRAPATDILRTFPFDVIVMDASFLCWRWVRPRHHFDEAKARYAWLADSPALKLAFPQDDYDHAQVLDAWLDDYKTDVIYSICPDHHEALFPRNYGRAAIEFALTGYIDDEDIALYADCSRDFADRGYDIGYRVRQLPPWFGSLGLLKSDLADIFKASAKGHWRTNISTQPKATLTGLAWAKFLGNCRFALASEGGSGILDYAGENRDACEAYRAARPAASSYEVVRNVLAKDGEITFAMPTPRLFEIAMAGCCPILLEGDYFGWLRKDVHYLSVKRDFSNIAEVFDRMRDAAAARRMAQDFRDVLLNRSDLRYRNHISGLFAAMRARIGDRATGVLDDRAYQNRIALHESAMQTRRSVCA